MANPDIFEEGEERRRVCERREEEKGTAVSGAGGKRKVAPRNEKRC